MSRQVFLVFQPGLKQRRYFNIPNKDLLLDWPKFVYIPFYCNIATAKELDKTMITPRKTVYPIWISWNSSPSLQCIAGALRGTNHRNDFWDNPIWNFIYTITCPLFMLLCGYFLRLLAQPIFGELVKKKFVQLVIPTSFPLFAIMYAFVMLTGYNPCPELMDFSWFGFFNAVWFLVRLLHTSSGFW